MLKSLVRLLKFVGLTVATALFNFGFGWEFYQWMEIIDLMLAVPGGQSEDMYAVHEARFYGRMFRVAFFFVFAATFVDAWVSNLKRQDYTVLLRLIAKLLIWEKWKKAIVRPPGLVIVLVTLAPPQMESFGVRPLWTMPIGILAYFLSILILVLASK